MRHARRQEIWSACWCEHSRCPRLPRKLHFHTVFVCDRIRVPGGLVRTLARKGRDLQTSYFMFDLYTFAASAQPSWSIVAENRCTSLAVTFQKREKNCFDVRCTHELKMKAWSLLPRRNVSLFFRRVGEWKYSPHVSIHVPFVNKFCEKMRCDTCLLSCWYVLRKLSTTKVLETFVSLIWFA